MLTNNGLVLVLQQLLNVTGQAARTAMDSRENQHLFDTSRQFTSLRIDINAPTEAARKHSDGEANFEHT